jgi:hypothetical protein
MDVTDLKKYMFTSDNLDQLTKPLIVHPTPKAKRLVLEIPPGILKEEAEAEKKEDNRTSVLLEYFDFLQITKERQTPTTFENVEQLCAMEMNLCKTYMEDHCHVWGDFAFGVVDVVLASRETCYLQFLGFSSQKEAMACSHQLQTSKYRSSENPYFVGHVFSKEKQEAKRLDLEIPPGILKEEEKEEDQPKAVVKEVEAEEKEKTKEKKKQPKKQATTNNMYTPKQQDSLFWCLYILKHGFFKYEMEIHNRYFIVEKKEKYNYIEMLRHNKELLKLHKIKPFAEIENDLAHNNTISVKTLFALCVVENINVLLVHKRKVYELFANSTTPIHVIHRGDSSQYSIETDATPEMIEHYKSTYYVIHGIETLLKSIGAYKLDELLDMCNKLAIPLDSNKKKQTKKEVYELLVLNY